MKTTSSNKLMFGFSAVAKAPRGNSYEPELIALSSNGGFKITPPVTKLLALEAGDYLMFLSNEAEVEAEIASHGNRFTEWCAKAGLDTDSADAAQAFRREFTEYGIAKGIQLFDGKGIALTTKERITNDDKQKLVRQNFQDIYEQAMNSGVQELVDALTREGVTEDEQIEILMGTIEGQELPKFKGAKLANSSKMTGIGQILTCSDGAMWNTLKADMEDKSAYNRKFSLNLDEIVKVELSNGYEIVTVDILILGSHVDEKVTARATKAEAPVEE